MNNIVSLIKKQAAMLPVILVSVVVGSITTTAVLAAIPDSAGIIHGCRSTLTGTLRVIDSEAGGACAAGEAELTWNQTGPAGPTGTTGATGPQGSAGPQGPQGELGPSSPDEVAYFAVDQCGVNGESQCLNSDNSKNIENFKHFEDWNPGFCLKVSFTPNVGLSTLGDFSAGNNTYIKFGKTAILQAEIDSICGPGYNLYGVNDGSFVSQMTLFR